MRYWAVVPAAGVGKRMGSSAPKQYVRLGERTVLEHALGAFCQQQRIAGIVLALAAQDRSWEQLAMAREPRIHCVIGGAERGHSVLAALQALAAAATAAAPRAQTIDKKIGWPTDWPTVRLTDWVLVHDGARPCLQGRDLQRLMDTLAEHPTGGLLATPVTDTLKRADARQEAVIETVERAGLWRALTPQMFRLGPLKAALEQALQAPDLQRPLTDEAQAMELAGHRPALIEGRADNLKITGAADLPLAEAVLREHSKQR